MFDPIAFVESRTGLGLPEDFNIHPIVELARDAFNQGCDAAGDADATTALLSALETIRKTTTDPVARLTAERALVIFKTLDDESAG